jgi:hypothetical protein
MALDWLWRASAAETAVVKATFEDDEAVEAVLRGAGFAARVPYRLRFAGMELSVGSLRASAEAETASEALALVITCLEAVPATPPIVTEVGIGVTSLGADSGQAGHSPWLRITEDDSCFRLTHPESGRLVSWCDSVLEYLAPEAQKRGVSIDAVVRHR